MAWFTKETLLGNGGLTDPYWYGGFSVFSIYPPLGYGIVGVIASIPGVGFILTYKIVLLLSYSLVGTTTYYIARKLGNGFSLSLFAGLIVILAYPVQASVGLWGWYSTIAAIPLALLSLILLEKAHDRNSAIIGVFGTVSSHDCVCIWTFSSYLALIPPIAQTYAWKTPFENLRTIFVWLNNNNYLVDYPLGDKLT